MAGEPGEDWTKDPGWGPSLRTLVPFSGVRRRRTRADPITATRAMFLAYVNALILFGFVLAFDSPFHSKGRGVGWAVAIAALALCNLVVVKRVERPLSCDSDAALIGSYRTRIFVRLAFAESTALLGFVGSFIVPGTWIYYFAVLCSAPAFARAAPSPAAFVRDQDELNSRGCARSLVAAFRHPQG
jgi:F0F1-type ATP synthase membrane subunit c/vacuolar-type H+-ATPase subunit K